MQPVKAAAVRSADFQNVYMVALRFMVAGVDSAQTGVWSTNSIDKVGAAIFAVDGIAKEFTGWTDGDKSSANISQSRDGVTAAKACVG
jgi:hypothetical protein